METCLCLQDKEDLMHSAYELVRKAFRRDAWAGPRESQTGAQSGSLTEARDGRGPAVLRARERALQASMAVTRPAAELHTFTLYVCLPIALRMSVLCIIDNTFSWEWENDHENNPINLVKGIY